MRKALAPRAAAPIAALALAACAPNYTLPPTSTPDAVRPGEQVVVPKDWWKVFGDPVLDRLIDDAFAASPTLEQAVARVNAAEARLGISRSQQLPTVNANLAGAKQQLSSQTNPQGPSGSFTVYQGNLSAFWEIDLWGRVRNEVAASRSDLIGAESGREAVRLSLASRVAQTYFQLRALDAQLETTRLTVESRENSYRLREKRFLGGMTSELDLRQAESELTSARAQLPDILTAISSTEGALAELVGTSPKDLFASGSPRGKSIDEIPVPPDVPEALPSDLLNRRPDLREAEEGLRAAQARVASAQAAWFPQVGLTGQYGGESLAFGDLFKGPARVWSYAGQLSLPLFNSGLTAAQVDLASANEKAAVANYRAAVIRSFADVRNAIVAKQQALYRATAREQTVAALRREVRLATLRYDNGYSNYLEVLDAERALFSAELALADARRLHLNAAVDLYRSLGGGWTPPAAPAE